MFHLRNTPASAEKKTEVLCLSWFRAQTTVGSGSGSVQVASACAGRS